MKNEGSTFSRYASVVELMQFLWKRKMWWLVPIVISLLVLGLLLTLAQSSAVGPLMYTIF